MNAAEAGASHANIVVALASYNHVRTIGAVARALRDRLAAHFGSDTARIVLADGGSTDGTADAARAAVGAAELVEVDCSPPAVSFSDAPYHGFPGRARALRAILQTMQQLKAQAGALVDPGLETADTQQIEHLIAPVLTGGFDYVSPYYARHPFDGAITKGIIYPVFRALYGATLRQPAAGEFGCSARMVEDLLRQDIWDREEAHTGIDLWLASSAVCGGFRVCEGALGVRTPAHPETAPDLSTTLAQVVGSLFADLELRADVWQRVRRTVAVPIFGAISGTGPDALLPNLERLIESFRLGYRELREIWTWVLPPRTIIELRKLAGAPSDRFRFDDRLWASIIYDFAFGYSLRVMPRDHLLRSLTPLYSGWMASWVLEIQHATPVEVEERLERVCVAFEVEKRYLISRWRWPERLRR